MLQPVDLTMSTGTTYTLLILYYALATHPDKTQSMFRFFLLAISQTYHAIPMMMNCLQTFSHVGTTANTSYVSAYGAMTDETGPANMKKIIVLKIASFFYLMLGIIFVCVGGG